MLVAIALILPAATAHDAPKGLAVYRVALGTRTDPTWNICGAKTARIWNAGAKGWERDPCMSGLVAWLGALSDPHNNRMVRYLGCEDLDREAFDDCCGRRAACIAGFVQVVAQDGVPVAQIIYDGESWEGWYHQYFPDMPSGIPPRVAVVIMEPAPVEEEPTE